MTNAGLPTRITMAPKGAQIVEFLVLHGSQAVQTIWLDKDDMGAEYYGHTVWEVPKGTPLTAYVFGVEMTEQGFPTTHGN